MLVLVSYSSAVSVNVDVTLDSHLGANFDARIRRITLSNQSDAFWLPDKDIRLARKDQILIEAPAGGASITAHIAVYIDPGRSRFAGLEALIEPILRRAR
ncbi:hypothetical protein LCGC14_0410400 [marine sediment metagenome]|uniref:Uncharacterized protein n=1 Tax=marine sediment metagenome TaxID=412755 RepID=A0A0F9VG83_9ZZZZ